ncbi:Holliday junction resolvase RuvX [Candidatus Chloroploca sp. Khr17]|uniref:Holliday junction resolvase RuvX n=1 Tax=Candidatus Chloroploca sp. Khr17 TaxID=2496869 RepID=UPI00101BE735|nr:Holliday junction resolvase RuvX [Candidatus Chloroploca sp. Khr17]
MYLAEERIIGLDVGERRIGIALSDASRMLASPLTTIAAQPQPQALERIRQLVREYGVVELVVGLPLTLRGEIGPQATLVQKFATLLETSLGLPIRLVDERLTTAAADQMLRELGVKPDKRKLQIDQVAASIILQDYLDQQRTS